MEAIEQPIADGAQPPIAAEIVQQPEIDPFLLHQGVVDMFPDLDLTRILQEYGHMTSEGLVNLIVDSIDEIPKKRGTKRKPTEENAGESGGETEESLSDTEEISGELLVDKMLGELLHTIKTELKKNDDDEVEFVKYDSAKNYLQEEFPNVRLDFIRRMFTVFRGNVVAVMIACFFCADNYGARLRKIVPSLNQQFWCQLATPKMFKKSKKAKRATPLCIQKGLERYTTILTDYEQLYPELLSGLKFRQQHRLIKWERGEEQSVECLVCYERVPVSRMIYCSAPLAISDSNQTLNGIISLDDDQPCSSSTAAAAAANNLSTLMDEGEQEGVHAFCRICLRGQAEAATTEMPLAEGGVGLKCMVPGCTNPILYSEVRQLLKREVRRKLDERILEENIGMASLQNLERCRKCNFAVEMDVPPEVNKVFHCPSCDADLCRLCDNDWDEDHFGITCDELDVKKNRDKKHRDLEKKINEVVIRKCPKCGTQFMKSEGCNKMTCRCGTKQCYICRATNIDYSHFCQHFRDPSIKNFKCDQCNKTCLLYQDARKHDENTIKQIRQEADQPGTSGGAVAAARAGPSNNANNVTNVQNNNRQAIRQLYHPDPNILDEPPPMRPRPAQDQDYQQFLAHIRRRVGVAPNGDMAPNDRDMQMERIRIQMERIRDLRERVREHRIAQLNAIAPPAENNNQGAADAAAAADLAVAANQRRRERMEQIQRELHEQAAHLQRLLARERQLPAEGGFGRLAVQLAAAQGQPEVCPTCPGAVVLTRQPDGTGICPTCNGRVAAPRVANAPLPAFHRQPIYDAGAPPPNPQQPGDVPQPAQANNNNNVPFQNAGFAQAAAYPYQQPFQYQPMAYPPHNAYPVIHRIPWPGINNNQQQQAQPVPGPVINQQQLPPPIPQMPLYNANELYNGANLPPYQRPQGYLPQQLYYPQAPPAPQLPRMEVRVERIDQIDQQLERLQQADMAMEVDDGGVVQQPPQPGFHAQNVPGPAPRPVVPLDLAVEDAPPQEAQVQQPQQGQAQQLQDQVDALLALDGLDPLAQPVDDFIEWVEAAAQVPQNDDGVADPAQFLLEAFMEPYEHGVGLPRRRRRIRRQMARRGGGRHWPVGQIAHVRPPTPPRPAPPPRAAIPLPPAPNAPAVPELRVREADPHLRHRTPPPVEQQQVGDAVPRRQAAPVRHRHRHMARRVGPTHLNRTFCGPAVDVPDSSDSN